MYLGIISKQYYTALITLNIPITKGFVRFNVCIQHSQQFMYERH